MKSVLVALLASVVIFALAGPSQARPQYGAYETRGNVHAAPSRKKKQVRAGQRSRKAAQQRSRRQVAQQRSRRQVAQQRSRRQVASLGSSYSGRSYSTGGSYRYNAGPRPKRWCGWWMRTQLGGGPEFNVAWNWRNYGRPTEPRIGAVVVWRSHVAMITGRTADGRWIVKGGNESGGVRERPRSVKGAIFRI